MKYKVCYTFYVKDLIADEEIRNEKKVLQLFKTASLAKRFVREQLEEFKEYGKFDNYDGDYLIQEYYNEDGTKLYIREFLVLPVGTKF